MASIWFENDMVDKLPCFSEDEEVGLAKGKSAQDDTSDEEQQWLAALEAGTLDDNGDFKKSKDPSLLTARQVGDTVKSLI